MVIVSKLPYCVYLTELQILFCELHKCLYYSNKIDVCITFVTCRLIKEYNRFHIEKDSQTGAYERPLLVLL